ncbi:tRNA dimethylallyltransferase [Pedobacter sp. UYP24]
MVLDKTLIVIVGPTAIGKTALAINLAQHFDTEIISADSRQFFREMNIGTAKPSSEELAAAPHHFVNSHSIQEFFSTGDFEIQALSTIDFLFRKENLAILVGGSGLYINAVCNGLDNLPTTDLVIRENLNAQFAKHGILFLRKELHTIDPEYFAKVDQSNPQRMIRGLEFYFSTGEKLSSYLTNTKKNRAFNIIKIGLNTDRSELYQRINNRVDQMMERGLLDEVKELYKHRNLNALNTVGYSELFKYLDGEATLQVATDQIKQNTRRFAKRQLTWFRKDDNIRWFEPSQMDEVITHIKENLFKPVQ